MNSFLAKACWNRCDITEILAFSTLVNFYPFVSILNLKCHFWNIWANFVDVYLCILNLCQFYTFGVNPTLFVKHAFCGNLASIVSISHRFYVIPAFIINLAFLSILLFPSNFVSILHHLSQSYTLFSILDIFVYIAHSVSILHFWCQSYLFCQFCTFFKKL